MFADPESHWLSTGIRAFGEPYVKTMRDGSVIMVLQTGKQDICILDMTGGLSKTRIIPVSVAVNNPPFQGPVKLADFSDGRIAWFASGLDATLLSCTNPDFSQPITWQVIGHEIQSAIVPISRSYGGIQVFVKDAGLGVCHRWYRPDGWSDWESLGGQLAGSITIQDNSNELPLIIGRGKDNSLWCIEHLVPNGWGPWKSAGGCFPGDPVTLRDTDKSISVFARGFDHSVLWAVLRDDGTVVGEWQPVGSPVRKLTACLSQGIKQLFAISLDGEVLMSAFTAGEWSDWLELGGHHAENIHATEIMNSGTLLTMQDTSGNIYCRLIR